MQSLSLRDRLVYALIGVVFGALYGALLALVAMVISGNAWNMAHVEATAVVFGVLAFGIGPFIGDAIAGVWYLIWGFLSALLFVETLAGAGAPERRPGFLMAIFWFGIATAVALYVALRVW